MIRTAFQTQLALQISNLTGNDFQEFVVDLMHHRYGSEGFTAPRRVKDGGADGIVHSKKAVIACWGPDGQAPSKVKNAFEKKVRGDYTSYKKNWHATYPNWIVVINRKPAPNEIKFVDELQAGSPVIGIDEILHMINNELSCASRRKIVDILKISRDLLSLDVISGLLEDILKNTDSEGIIEYTSPLYITDKISLNFPAYEIDTADQEYSALQEEYFIAIANSFEAFDDEEKKRIKRRIQSDYLSAYGDSFSIKINNLTTNYLSKYSIIDDDEYRGIIRALLFWIFEQCLIGKRTTVEQSGSHASEVIR